MRHDIHNSRKERSTKGNAVETEGPGDPVADAAKLLGRSHRSFIEARRFDALFDGYHGRPFDRDQREALMRLILLHRYSNLKAQIAVPGWQAAPDFATLAALIWP